MSQNSSVSNSNTQEANLIAERKRFLREHFPECFTDDNKIDWNKLKIGFGGEEASDSAFSLKWPGIQESFNHYLADSTKTLVPVMDDSINFDTTNNIFIEGETLETSKVLRKSYVNRVKMIYFDPPYNTGSDLIYDDNRVEPLETYLEQTGSTSAGIAITANPDTEGRFHSQWLSFIYPRMLMCRDLLAEDGVIFVSIDDNELENMKRLMNNVFGADNFLAQCIVTANPGGRDYGSIAIQHEYLLVYGKNEEALEELIPLVDETPLPFEDDLGKFDIQELRNRNPNFTPQNRPHLAYPFYVNPNNSFTSEGREFFAISLTQDAEYSEEVLPTSNSGPDVWRWGCIIRNGRKPKTVTALEAFPDDPKKCEIVACRVRQGPRSGQWNIYQKSRNAGKKAQSITTWNKFSTETGTERFKHLFDGKGLFSHPKPVDLIKTCILLSTSDDSIILDPMAGSGTTADAVLQLNKESGGNRKFICIQLPEAPHGDSKQICEDEGIKKISEITLQRIKKVLDELGGEQGVKVFRLANSDFKKW